MTRPTIRVGVAIAAALAVTIAIAGCSGSSPEVDTTGPTTTAPRTETTLAIPDTLPPTTDTTIPPATAATPSTPSTVKLDTQGRVDCGTWDAASGWPTTIVPSPSFSDCLVGAFANGTPAVFVLSQQTDGEGGSPVVTTYEVIGAGVVQVTTDATRAADRPQTTTVERCTTLVADFGYVVKAGNCSPA